MTIIKKKKTKRKKKNDKKKKKINEKKKEKKKERKRKKKDEGFLNICIWKQLVKHFLEDILTFSDAEYQCGCFAWSIVGGEVCLSFPF